MQQQAPIPFALALATVAFLFTVVWGRPLITYLKAHGYGKKIRVEGPESHQVKMGTPTMGGIMIIVPVVIITFVLNLANFLSGSDWGKRILSVFNFAEGSTLIGKSILVPMLVMLAFGLLGMRDDLSGIRGRNGVGNGFKARFKASLQTILAIAAAMALYFFLDLSSVAIPGVETKINLGLFYIPIAAFIIIGSTNAVNLTDGLDGLAGSTAAIAFAAFGLIALLQGQYPLMSFCFTVVGAIFAFLWYNSHPAELFMGDTGALALGATLGVVALMTGQWLLLPVVGLVFVAETLSDIIQVSYFKWTKKRTGEGKRIFKMAPLHHHFEILGWSETQIVWRFFLISMLAALLGIALALL
jgi:phospho-N-acetylmuramoyl-pentapeptide-transferase